MGRALAPEDGFERARAGHEACVRLFSPRNNGKSADVRSRSSLASHPFVSLTLRPIPQAPISHTSAAAVPVVGTSKRPNGKKRKRGRGRGEEEEADRGRVEEQGGWEMVLVPQGEGKLDWHLWEGQ